MTETSKPLIVWLVFLSLIILLPQMLSGRYSLFLATMVGIYVIMVVGLNLIMGFTGLISLAHGAFFGIGAYVCAILQTRQILSYWPALGVAVVFTALLGALIGLAMLRTKGPYLAIGTMCLSILTALVLLNWESLTGGTSLGGIAGPGKLTIGGWRIDFLSGKNYYYLVAFFVMVSITGVYRLLHSRTGRAFVAIRDQEELAGAIGINIMLYKILSFSIGSLLAALAGCLYAGFMGAIDPDIASMHMSFNLLVMTIVGGAASLSGAIVGTVLLWMLPELLQASNEYKPLIFGAILLIIIIFTPTGITGRLKALHRSLAKWIL
jgi:branched-chain amino acid transport system permease protein